MTKTQKAILVFGATGRQGGAVVRALLAASRPVRALVRHPTTPASVALRDAGAELVTGSLTDADAIRAAMAGVDGVFSVLPADMAEDEEVRIGVTIADLAVESGVMHLVYSSGGSVGDTLTGVPRFDAKPRIEAHIRGLPIAWTIVRPMIFMDMLARAGYGLDEGRFSFLLDPDQAMQLVAVDDIGKVVAAIFANRDQFGGQVLKLASDTVTGRDLEAILTEAAARQIRYSRISDAALAADSNLSALAASLASGPLSDHADLDALREIVPDLTPLRSWLAGAGRPALEAALGDS